MIQETIQYLNQSKIFLTTIHKTVYQQPIQEMRYATIGQHTRHFIACYQCLLEQYEAGELCYDNRRRAILVEENPIVALAEINHIIQLLPTLNLSKKVLLKTKLDQEITVETTINRELLYNLQHTTHHLAMIKTGLAILQADMTLPENFGVANATTEYHKTGE